MQIIVPSTRPYLCHTSRAQNQKEGPSLSKSLFLSPFYETLVNPSLHLWCSYGCPYQILEHLSNTKLSPVWCPLHLCYKNSDSNYIAPFTRFKVQTVSQW